MPSPAIQRYQRPMTWSDYYSLQFLRYLFAVAAAGLVGWGIYGEHRDRPSLQWPKVSGTVTQCDDVVHYHKGTHHSVAITYSYAVNGRRYVGNNIARWSPDYGDGRPTGQFEAAHPVSSAVDVYYKPEHPENAVLIPGPDEARNRVSIWGGLISFVGGVWWIFFLREKAAEVKARVRGADDQAEETTKDM